MNKKKVYKLSVNYSFNAEIFIYADNDKQAGEFYKQLPKPDISVSRLADSLIRTGYEDSAVVFPDWKIDNSVKAFASVERGSEKELARFTAKRDKEREEILKRNQKSVSDK